MLARADEEEEEEEEEEDGVFFMFLLGDFSSESSVTRCFERGQSVDPAVASPCVGGDFVASGTGCILLGEGGGSTPCSSEKKCLYRSAYVQVGLPCSLPPVGSSWYGRAISGGLETEVDVPG